MSNPMPEQPEAARAQCVKFDLDLPAFLEGESRPEVMSHARQCPFCSVILADLHLIQSQATQVLLEDPPSRVWANVRATLDAEGVFREPTPVWLRWLPQTGLLRYSAAFAATAFLVLFGTLLLVRHPSSTPGLNSTQTSSTIAAKGEPVASADLRLEATVSEMEKSYRSRETNIDPVLHASYQKGLNSLDNSIRECKASMAKEPGNTLAREYLTSAFQQKAAVLTAALEYDGQ
jgi:hypothetical protein